MRLRLPNLTLLEAGLAGLFFVQALRFLIGMVYSRVGGASIVLGLDPATAPAGTVDPTIVSGEITLMAYMLALPLLTVVLGRIRPLLIVGAVLLAVGRALMIANAGAITPTMGAAIAVGGGLFYLALLVRHRASAFPYFFILGLAADQLFRAVGNTVDPSWSASYLNIQVILSLALAGLSVLNLALRVSGPRGGELSQDKGLLPFWGGAGLAGMLFLELSLLSLPNAIAGRADVDYTIFAPLVTAATLLPLIPWVRRSARSFIALFDGSVRGWLWMLLVALLFVLGLRLRGLVGGAALIAAQFGVSMMWWWLVRPQAERERNFTGLWMVLGILGFLLLVAGDNFTYEYAYVRNLGGDAAFLNTIIPPFLRGFRGMGLGLLLLGGFLAALPMIQTQRRIPWTNGSTAQSFFGLAVLIAASVGVAYAVRPPLIAGVRDPERVRIGTYNVHGGFDEFYANSLESIARTIQQSGANVVLLQQVEGGRLTSFGVDQPLWLARRLGMDTRFYPTNEGLQGLAVLSNIEIVYDDGAPLTSVSQQTGLQRVQVRPDAGVITLYNTWLGYLLETGDGRTLEQQEQDQVRQLNEIFALIRLQHPDGNLGRTVVGGTFNNIPDSPLLDQMRKAGFSDPFAGLPLELAATFVRTGYPRARLDYLWTRSLGYIGGNAMDTTASDHRMAVIEAIIRQQ
jgi:endonuclease/exonuclease/phosphatase family metal-dependent hydrolase